MFAASRPLLILTALIVAALVVVSPADARMSSRQYLETQLSSSGDFRNRIQAALALGRMRSVASRTVLERALGADPNEAVRAAAAAALGEIGDRRAIPALRRAERDRSAAVRHQAATALAAVRGESGAGGSGGASDGEISWRSARYVVVVGSVRNNTNFGGQNLEQRLRSAVLQNLASISGVVPFAENGAIDGAAQREIDRRRLPLFRVDATLSDLEHARRGSDTRIRCTVNLVLMDERTSNVRGVLSGSASATERTNADRRQALRMAGASTEAAVRGAMASAGSAFQQAARGR